MSAVSHAPVVLIDGDDESLVAQKARSVVTELVGEADRDLVVEDFSGEEIDLSVVADACSTPPFFADLRVVVLREVGSYGADALRPLLAYIENPLPTTRLVLIAGGGRLSTKLLSAVKSAGMVLSTSVSGKEAGAWVLDRIHAAPVRLDASAASLLESHLGEDLGRLESVLELLGSAYGSEVQVGREEVVPYLGEAGSVAPWDLTDAIDAGRTDLALSLLRRLLSAGERHPLVMLSMLHRHFHTALRLEGVGQLSEAKAAEMLGIAKGRSTFAARKAMERARRLGNANVYEALTLIADAELALKGKLEWPDEAVLEVLVARLCRLSRSSVKRTAGSVSGARPG